MPQCLFLCKWLVVVGGMGQLPHASVSGLQLDSKAYCGWFYLVKVPIKMLQLI